MSPKELVTDLSKEPHVHYVIQVKDITTGQVDEKRNTIQYSESVSIEDCLNTVTEEFRFTEYVKHYAFYKNEATEYIRFEATLLNENLKLTSDIFTCYCEPLNKDQEPPF